MKRGLHWIRVQLDHEGKVVSHRMVERPEDDGGLIFYVRARDFEDADKRAYKSFQRARLRERRKRYKELGLCKCGRDRDLEGPTCSWCIERRKVHKERYHAKLRGEEVPPADWRGTRLARQSLEQQELRLSILVEIENAAESMPPGRFKHWLGEQIAKLQKGRSAA